MLLASQYRIRRSEFGDTGMDSKYFFQDILLRLQTYWKDQQCAILQPYDLAVGAATFHPATFLRAIGPEPWRCAYPQACRRPSDGRYGDNPNRLQQYYQFQVVLKPSPDNVQELYIQSLQALGIDTQQHDVRFVEDNWESPTLGATGLGWEVWINGMEVSQFTYFQQCGGLECRPVSVEITYGVERFAMYLQEVDSVFDLIWAEQQGQPLTYGEIFHHNEIEQSAYNFEFADADSLLRHFDDSEKACMDLVQRRLPLPAYEHVITASHSFNLLESRHILSTTERQRYILRIRKLSQQVAKLYYEMREELGFPLLREGQS